MLCVKYSTLFGQHDKLSTSTCDVEKLQTKFTFYSSFCISCEVQYREIILDPNMWESGVIIRPFYGSLLRADGETPDNS